MDEQTVNQLDSLLLQLDIETRERVQKKDDVKKEIEMLKSSIQKKKDYIDTTKKTISILNGEIQQKQDTVKFIKENTKSLQQTGNLILQYEKKLEAELEKKQDNYNKDEKLFQERFDNYKNVFQQYKDKYCQNEQAQKLLQIQTENEEIEKRVRETENQIIEKEKELTDILGADDSVSICDGDYSKCPETEVIRPDMKEIEERDIHQEPELQRPAEEEVGDDGMIVEEKDMMSKSDMDDQTNQEGEQPEKIYEQDENSDLVIDASEENDGDDGEKNKDVVLDESVICPPPSPAKMKAALATPTFSLNNSPYCSPEQSEISQSLPNLFFLSSTPNTPVFSKFTSDFDVSSPTEEASPFIITSSFFGDKKSPESGPKFSGFLFDEGKSQHEEFSFSFSSENTQKKSSTRQTTGADDSFPFTFSFGK